MKLINVIGLGYIGLPTALMLASHGNAVVGTDIKSDIIEQLNHGQLSFEEEGMEQLYHDAIESGIQFSGQYQVTDFYIVSVPTPYDQTSKKVDASYVVEAVKSVLQKCLDQTIIVIESTISPGTIEKSIKPLTDDFMKQTNKMLMRLI